MHTPLIPVEKWPLRPNPADPRDYMYRTRVGEPVPSARPRRVINKRPWAPNQGGFGTCAGFAGADAMGVRHKTILSPLFLYRNAKAFDGFDGEGTYIRAIMSVLRHNGIPLESLYPYSQYKTVHVFPPVSQEVTSDALTRKIDEYVSCISLDEILDAIWRYGSVVCGITVMSNFRTAKEFLPMPAGTIEGGHGVDLIGYDEDLEHTYPDGKTYKGFALLANSHGITWGADIEGNKGCSWIPFEYFFGSLKLWTSEGEIDFPYAWDFTAPIKRTKEEKMVTFIMDVAAKVENGRTLVPLRAIGEALGFKVDYTDAEKKITCTGYGRRVTLWIDKKELILEML